MQRVLILLVAATRFNQSVKIFPNFVRDREVGGSNPVARMECNRLSQLLESFKRCITLVERIACETFGDSAPQSLAFPSSAT